MPDLQEVRPLLMDQGLYVLDMPDQGSAQLIKGRPHI